LKQSLNNRSIGTFFDQGVNMKTTIKLVTLLLITSACGFPSLLATASPSGEEARTPSVSPTETAPLAEAPTSEPSATPTASLLDLEIVEWSEFPYADLADPSNTDTHVEVLIRNPNDVPVRIDQTRVELGFVNAAGEVVYSNPNPFFYIWEGSWMLPGETAALSACVCFWTSGIQKQDWESLKLTAPLEVATELAYTLDVEVTVGEFFSLAETHLGGDGLAAEITMSNTGDQVLESIPLRVFAYDASGRYVGMATFGNAVASFTEATSIQPGETASGLVVSDINYIDMSVPLTYEVAAIGILAK
jgi:hypothetical protein